MKQKYIKLYMLLTAFAFILSATAQHHVNTPDGRSLSSVIKKEAPIGWGNNIKDIVFFEDFSNGGFDNWTIVGEGAENWFSSESNQAGGNAPEARMGFSPVFTGSSRFVSPVINTSGYSELSLTFLQVLDLWSGGGGFWVSVETTSDGGTTWNQVWELEWTTTEDYYAFETLGVATADVGSENFQLCFKYEDNSDLIDRWVLDNITLGDNPALYDVTPSAIYGFEDFIYGGDDVFVSADINSYGSETVSFDVKLEITDDGTLVYESTKSISDMAFGDVVTVDFDSWTAVEGENYSAIVTTLLSEDEYPDNDQIMLAFTIYSGDSYCIPVADCSWEDGFTDFAFAGIENYESGCSDGGYGVFTELEASVEIGDTYTATMAAGYANNFASIWIDFNSDLEFSESELILTDFPMGGPGVLTDVDITIPGWGLPGTTTMRIGAAYGVPSSPDPCAALVYGEWEDYTVTVTGSPIEYDAGVKEINMSSLTLAQDITPMATVKNYGSETISFPVTMTIEDADYSSTVEVLELAAGEELIVEFDVWSSYLGQHTVEVCTELSNDENVENDCSDMLVTVSEDPRQKVVMELFTGTW